MAPPGPPPEEAENVAGASAANTPAAANGPAEGVKDWERPWTLDEIRKSANNWSLAGDAGLLEYLRDFSQKMISRTHEIEKEVDSLVHESKLTSVRVNNVFNDFIMLANTQFVENRVYDDDVSQEETPQEEKKPEQEKTREQVEAELIPKVTEAIRLGVNVIDEAFEKLDTNVANSDSEEDDDTAYRVDPILEAKDPYVVRPLPFLIGTPNFMEDETVGLEDISDEEETDHGSLSESESEEEKKKEESSEEYSYSESESGSDTERKPQKKQKEPVSDSEEESDSEGSLFGTSDKKKKKVDSDEEDEEDEEDDESEEEDKPKKPAGGFAAELAAKIGVAPKAPASDEGSEGGDEWEDEAPKEKKKSRSESAGSKHEKKKKERDKEKGKSKSKHRKKEESESDPFGAPEEEDDDLFGSKGGLFASSKKGLFDDDDEEGGLFDDVVKNKKKKVKEEKESESEEEEKPVEKKRTRTTSSGKKVPAGGVSIFGGGDDDLFSKSTKEEESDEDEPAKSAPPPKKIQGGGGGLFDDDDEDDLFGGSMSSTKSAKDNKQEKKEPEKKDPASSLFDDDEDDLFGGAPPKKEPEEEKKPAKKKPEKKMPAGAVSIFGNAPNPMMAALNKQRPPSDDEGEKDDWSGGEKSRSASLKSSHSGSSKSSLQKSDVNKSSRSGSIFDDEPDDDGLFSSPTKPKSNSLSKTKPKTAASSLFDDDDGDLFGGAAAPPAKPPAAKKTETQSKPKKTSLFDGDEGEDEDLFTATAAMKPKDSGKKKPVGGVSLFPGGADLFGKKEEPQPKKEEVKKEEPKKEPVTKKISLFDADEEEEGDLFGGGGGGPRPPPVETKKGRGKSLFEDEDVLFGGRQEESPGVDLFGQSPPVSPSAAPDKKLPVQTSPSRPEPVKPASKPAGLFASDEEDDLFSTGPKKESKPDQKVEISGVTETESTDTQEKHAEPEVVKPKKPVGGVSMFGGMDPFAAAKKNKPEPEQKSEIKEEKKPAKTKDPLFGGDDDDAGDLFSTHTVKKPEVKPKEGSKPRESHHSESKEDDLFSKSTEKEPEPEPEVVKPKRPAGAVSMFGGTDPFSAAKKGPKVEEKPTEKKNKDALFGGNDEDEEDLFGAPKKAVTKPRTNSKPFQSEPEKPVEPEPKPEPVAPVTKPKRPPGAVSMFGGMDPFGATKKSPPAEEPASPKQDDFFSSVEEPAASRPTPISVSPGKSPGKIGKLQNTLAINPAAMLPGAAPPVKEPVPLSVGFDEPPEARTLHSANKERAKIQTRRRPPSRKGRQSAVLSGEVMPDDFFTSPTQSMPPSDFPSPGAATPPSITSPVSESPRVPSHERRADNSTGKSGKTDLFGNEDLFHTESAKPSLSVINTKSDQGDSDLFNTDTGMFSSKGAKTKQRTENIDDLFAAPVTKTTKPKSNSVEGDDLFNSVPSTKSSDTKKTKTKTAAPADDNDDDIFTSSKLAKPKEKKKVSDMDGDLFAPLPTKSKRDDITPVLDQADTEKAVKKDQKTVLPEDDIFTTSKGSKEKSKTSAVLDDDIFGDSSVNKKKDVSKKTDVDDHIFADSSLKNKTSKVSKDDDDDLFGAKNKTEKKKPKKAATKDEDLFKDDTDIFADIPAAKPKEKKKKKTAAPKKQVFKDDIDDIFADAAPVKPKEKKKKAADKPKAAPVDVSDIFDDPLMK